MTKDRCCLAADLLRFLSVMPTSPGYRIRQPLLHHHHFHHSHAHAAVCQQVRNGRPSYMSNRGSDELTNIEAQQAYGLFCVIPALCLRWPAFKESTYYQVCCQENTLVGILP